jgi:hypothetical protein
MPKKLINDYFFYKLICLDNSVELCYVGSTANWKERQRTHKSVCNNENSKSYNTKIYKIIRENGGWDNFKMVQLGTREQLTKREAEQIEEEYRIELKANMNTIKCFRTEEQRIEQLKEYQQEYNEANRDKILEYQQEYREANRDKLLEYHQNYRVENKDKIKERQQEYREANRDKINERQQEYNEANRDKINERQQEYNEANRDKINEKALEKVKCDCGCMIRKNNLSTHKKTPKHIKIMEMKTK